MPGWAGSCGEGPVGGVTGSYWHQKKRLIGTRERVTLGATIGSHWHWESGPHWWRDWVLLALEIGSTLDPTAFGKSPLLVARWGSH